MTACLTVSSSLAVRTASAAIWERTSAARYVEVFIRRWAARASRAAPSPGLNRMVIRSVAASRGDALGISSTEDVPGISNARSVVTASAHSESPRLAANSANRRFSSGASRTVMVGNRELPLALVTRADPLVQHIADTSLSCPQQNTNSKTLLRVRAAVRRSRSYGKIGRAHV